MNIPNKTFLVLMIGAASLAVFGPMASAKTMQARHFPCSVSLCFGVAVLRRKLRW